MITIDSGDVLIGVESLGKQDNSFLNVKELTLMIDASNTCQLACTYCYYGEKGCVLMDVNKVYNATTTFSSIFRKVKKVTYHYMGGEPLIGWSKIQKLNTLSKNYFDSKNIAFNWSMTSNLINLNNEIMEVMIKEGAGIHASIDGPEHVQDKNRPYRSGRSSFEKVDKNINKALKISPNDTARATITPYSSHFLHDITAYLIAKGYKKIGLFPAYNMTWEESDLNAWSEGIENAYHLALNNKCKISTVLREKPSTSNKFSYCGAGRGLWAFDVNGVLYNCHHLTNQPEYAIVDASDCSPDMILDAITQKTLSPKVINVPEKCTQCPALNYCSGGCWAENMKVMGSSQVPESLSCTFRQITATVLEKYYQLNQVNSRYSSCSNCYSCQRCDECQHCQKCEGCISCDECQRCDECQSCDSCDECQSCQSCQFVVCCMVFCDQCEGCDSCQGCESCDHDPTGPCFCYPSD